MSLKIGVATTGSGGLKGEVSDVFGKSKTFTIIELEGDEVKDTSVLKNPGATYEHGSGPVAGKLLTDEGVEAVICGEFGPGANTLLEQAEIYPIKVEAGTTVKKAISVGEVQGLSKKKDKEE